MRNISHSKLMQSTGEPTGDVVYKTPVTTIETYGMPLPVMVTEALTFGKYLPVYSKILY